MFFNQWRSLTVITGISFGITTGALSALLSTPASAQRQFPDVEPSYWATPFITRLAQQGVIAGYPDGTFKPKQAVDRDEFAALISSAFEGQQERSIPSAGVFKDVPSEYWAAPPIQEAYEAGFMNSYSEGYFRPREEMTKTQALTALARGLNLAETPQNQTAQTAPAATAVTTPASEESESTPNQRRKRFRPLAFPLAATRLMSPFYQAALAVDPPAKTVRNTNTEQADRPDQEPSPEAAQGAAVVVPNNTQQPQPTTQASNPQILSAAYQDADQIPDSAQDEIARLTQAGIVVNYPNPEYLNPNQPITRGEAAALVHQALVNEGQLEPLPDNTQANQYIVK